MKTEENNLDEKWFVTLKVPKATQSNGKRRLV